MIFLEIYRSTYSLQANIWHWTMSPEYTYTVEKLFLQLGSADNNGLEIGSFNGFWPVVQ